MKIISYGVAMSLDGYIAGPNGESDWIVPEPDFNFAELWAQFDTGIMGRKTYEPAVARLGEKAFQGMKTYVVSRTMKPADHSGVTVISQLSRESIQAVRAQSEKDIWLFGGGETFRALLDMGEVDEVRVSVCPVLLGGGVPLLPSPAQRQKLTLVSQKAYRFGMVSLQYEVQK
jgi:dihydrofolate reductase